MEQLVSPENVQWLIWLGIGVVFILAELVVPAFIIIFFGIGALVAGATAFFGASIPVQLVVFGVSSLVLIVLLRRVMASTFSGAEAEDEDAASDPAGALAEVTEAISPNRPGRIKFQGSFWTARCAEPVEIGSMVRIVKRDEKDVNAFVVEKEQ